MRRQRLRLVVLSGVVALAASGCWTQFGGVATRTGFASGESTLTAANVGSIAVAWAQHVPGGVDSPVIWSGRVFVAGSDTVTAFDAKSGSLAWQKSFTEGDVSATFSDPAVIANRIAVPYTVGRFGDILSFDPGDGSSTGSGATDELVLGAPAVRGTTVAVTGGAIAPGMALVDVRYGDKKGFVDFSSSGSLPLTSSPMILGNLVYVSHGTRLLAFALDSCPASGFQSLCAPQWNVDLHSAAGLPVALSATSVGVPLAIGNVAVVEASTGRLQWTAGGGTANAQPPAVDDTGTMYVATADGSVRAFSTVCDAESCLPRWTTQSTGAALSSQPVVANGVVYVGTVTGRVYAFDARRCSNGCAPSFSTLVDGAANRVVPIVDTGTLYATTNNGTVAAYRLP